MTAVSHPPAVREAQLDGVLEALDQACEQFGEPMSLLNSHERGERLASDVAEIVRHALARIAFAAPLDDGWLPIGDAPKDGTVVIGYRDDGSDHGVVFLAQWIVEMDGDEVAYAGWWDPDSDQDCRPTHFIPLPSAPTSPILSIGEGM